MRGLIAAALVLLMAGAASASYPSGACVRAVAAASAADTSIVELETSALGGGITITSILPSGSAAATQVGATITGTTFIDEASAVVTPSFIFGNLALTTIIRTGQDDGGALPAQSGSFMFPVSTPPLPFMGLSLTIPPGQFVSFRGEAVNTAADVTLCFNEIQLP